ncbi:hypothetical protein [Sinobacterium caligoides]|nr:hypothetical protein [Sinobacterium caligoides]
MKKNIPVVTKKWLASERLPLQAHSLGKKKPALKLSLSTISQHI